MTQTAASLGTAEVSGRVCAEGIESWCDSLLVLDEGLSDASRVDQLRALERLKCAAEAAQATLAAELDASMRSGAAGAGVPRERQGRGVAAQVGLARRVSGHRGERLLSLATVVTREMPHTMRAWRLGLISERRVMGLVRETANLDLVHRQRIDRELAGDAQRLSRMGDKRAEGEAARLAAELDPVGVAGRRRDAEAQRHTGLRPAPDGMTRFSALLRLKDGVAVDAVLGYEADQLRAAGDRRTRGQIMADTLVNRVLMRDARAESDEDAESAAASSAEPGLMINLIVSDEVLLGDRHGGGWVEGVGIVPGDLLRQWIADRLDAEGGDAAVWMRRVYEKPDTGDLVGMDSKARFFHGGLAQFLRVRDQVCRMPYCDAPIRHLDHVQAHDDDGPTSAFNGQGVCEAHNYAKQARGWSARPRPGPVHTVETTTPTGHTYPSEAPHRKRSTRQTIRPGLTIDVDVAWMAG